MTTPPSQSCEHALSARGVSFVYGHKNRVTALDDVSLDVRPGEMVALLGPNGSGKSTLLRAMSATASPTRGIVRLFGTDIQRVPAVERSRRLAFVPQRVRVDLPFTAREVVMMGRAPYQGRFGLEQRGDEPVVVDAMRRMQVAHLEGRRMSELSGGEAQRVMLAQALAQQPEVMLLDEPTSHLDINFQAEIMELLASLHRERSLTVMLSLHDLNLASLYAERVVLLRGGRLHAQGPPLEVITEPTVREVYGAHVHVGRYPTCHAPLVSLRRRVPAGVQKEDAPAVDAKN